MNEDKVVLEAEVERLKKFNKDLSDKNRMQLEQVNVLLLEKVNLQSEGIGHREKMLQRERDFGDLRASISGKDLPEDIKARLLALHEENLVLKENVKTVNDKFVKARQVALVSCFPLSASSHLTSSSKNRTNSLKNNTLPVQAPYQ